MLNTMKNTARQPLADTLTDLRRAMDEQRAFVIAYADADEAPSIRTIEIHDIITGGDDGAVFVQSMDLCRQTAAGPGLPVGPVPRLHHPRGRPGPAGSNAAQQ
ncbi:hypothetical protein [Streptomyces sp. NPDC029041]|uniref:hypothetical protein n=1 Tax=Streptomyces sp. NPDC029041 TaxID=3155727 RepID=UPI0033FB6C6D